MVPAFPAPMPSPPVATPSSFPVPTPTLPAPLPAPSVPVPTGGNGFPPIPTLPGGMSAGKPIQVVVPVGYIPAQVAFDREVNATTVDATTFKLERSGGDAVFGNGNDVAITPASVTVPAANTQSAVMSLAGVASGIGASISTTLFGLIAETPGRASGFLVMALVGCVAFAIVWALMPETKHSARPA